MRCVPGSELLEQGEHRLELDGLLVGHAVVRVAVHQEEWRIVRRNVRRGRRLPVALELGRADGDGAVGVDDLVWVILYWS